MNEFAFIVMGRVSQSTVFCTVRTIHSNASPYTANEGEEEKEEEEEEEQQQQH